MLTNLPLKCAFICHNTLKQGKREIREYCHKPLILPILEWSGRRESNPRRPAWEADILPLNYSRMCQAEDRQGWIAYFTLERSQPSLALRLHL